MASRAQAAPAEPPGGEGRTVAAGMWEWNKRRQEAT